MRLSNHAMLIILTAIALCYGVAVFYAIFFSDFHAAIKVMAIITLPYFAMEIDAFESKIS